MSHQSYPPKTPPLRLLQQSSKNLYLLNDKERDALIAALASGQLCTVHNPYAITRTYRTQKHSREDNVKEWDWDMEFEKDGEKEKKLRNENWVDLESQEGSSRASELRVLQKERSI